MDRNFYELDDNLGMKGRWFLNGLYDSRGTEFDGEDFSLGRPIAVGPPLVISLWNDDEVAEVQPPLVVTLRRAGASLDFTYADGAMPVVTTKVADLLERICGADIQRFPVMVEGTDDWHEIINVLPLLDCIDKDRSEVESWWTEKDERPDKLGDPMSVIKLVLDPDRIGEHHIFRIRGWNTYPFASGVLKAALERTNVSGITYCKDP